MIQKEDDSTLPNIHSNNYSGISIKNIPGNVEFENSQETLHEPFNKVNKPLNEISKRKKIILNGKYNKKRMKAHQNMTQVRVKGKNGEYSDLRYVNIEKNLKKQRDGQYKRRFILKAKQNQKIQERIEKYQEEKIQREIEFLEEAKKLEFEKNNREKVKEERR